MTMLQTTETLTPRQLAARKAWVTMRARKAAAQTTAAIILPIEAPAPAAIINVSTDADFAVAHVYREPELEPVTEFRFVSLFVDDNTVGCGQREFIVLDMSRTKVRLFYSPSLETITVHRQLFDQHHMPVSRRRYNPQRIAARIRARIAMADKVNGEAMEIRLTDGGVDAQRALDLIGR